MTPESPHTTAGGSAIWACPPRTHRVSVVIVDDHHLIRRGLRHAFDLSGQFDVVAEAPTGTEALDLVAALAPDVVTMDVQLPDLSGLDVTRRLRKRHPGLGIVVLTTFGGDRQLFAAMNAGASAFVQKSAPVQQVMAAARQAADSPRSFSAADLAQAIRRQLATGQPQDDLNPPETQTLRLLATGASVTGIAAALDVTHATARHLITCVLAKLNASTRVQALMTATRLGLIHPGCLADDITPAVPGPLPVTTI